MSDDLVRKLREARYVAFDECGDYDLAQEAATALTEARAEIERLREQVFELEHGVEDQMEEAAYHAKQRAAAESELSTLRARVREVVGPFAQVSRTYDLEQESRRVGWTDFIATVAPSKEQCDAARQLNEDLK